MNSEQQKAARKLKLALDACHKAGLMGGVFSGSFQVWPEGVENPQGCGDFFEAVHRVGGDCVDTKMKLDGGAGV